MADLGDIRPIEDLVRGLLRPLVTAADSPAHAARLLRELGYAPPVAPPALTELPPILSALEDGLANLRAAIETEDEQALAVALTQITVDLGRFFVAVQLTVNTMQTAFAGTDFLAATNFAAEFPQRLIDYLVIRYLEAEHPVVQSALVLLGAITNEDVTTAPTPFHVPYRQRVVHWDRIPQAIFDPLTAMDAVLWNGNSLRYLHLIGFLHELATALGLPTGYTSPQHTILTLLNDGNDLTNRNDYDRLLSLFLPLYRDRQANVALEIYPIVNTATGDVEGAGVGVGLGGQLEIPLSDVYRMLLKVNVISPDAFGVMVRRGVAPRLISGLFGPNPARIADNIQFGVSAAVEPTDKPRDRPLLRLEIGGSTFEVGAGALRFGFERLAKERFFIEGELREGRIVIAAGDADGFIATILPPDGIQASFDLAIGFATDTGLYFSGSGGLEIQLPTHIELGPVEITALTIAVKLRDQEIPTELGATIRGNLGPLQAVVENVGLRATFSFPPGGGNVGPLDLSFGFKPPNGVGLSLDAGVVKGGGYLFIDPDRGEYAGALELTISDFLSLKAIGLITTRMPDGSRGFSLIIIITAEFSPGLQLGYGFTLIGVGGLLGLNRTVVLESLALGVRTGAVNGILFPVDPVANAPRIISDIRTIFPPVEDRFLIGPMAKLGWGTPTLISLALGVIIEIPGNIAILGILQLALPTPDEPLINLQVNFIGAIEFDKKRGWFFAALYESRVVFITLEGEMGVLVAFGADANVLLSVGGFHPRYSPPPLPFPSPRRIAFDVINTPVARVRVEGYFAVTTNTVQFGARAEMFFGFDEISVEGHMAFDALLRLSPFYFIVEISIGASLNAFGIGVFEVDLQFTLEGITPWRARGRGSVRLLFIKISADFDVTWGESRDTTLPPIMVVPLLQAEFENATNWRAIAPPSHHLLVSLRQLQLPRGTLVLHPLGTLEISQSAVPLGITLDRIGSQKPADANRFGINVKAGGFIKRQDTHRRFAPAQFRELNDAQRLSAPPFEEEVSGLVLGIDGAELRTGRAVKRSLRYEVTTIDTYYRRLKRRFSAFGKGLFGHFIKNAAIAKSGLAVAKRNEVQPFDDRIAVIAETFAVVSANNNRPVTLAAVNFSTESQAREWMSEYSKSFPDTGSQFRVVPASEMREAA
jgi:hypothetical protein